MRNARREMAAAFVAGRPDAPVNIINARHAGRGPPAPLAVSFINYLMKPNDKQPALRRQRQFIEGGKRCVLPIAVCGASTVRTS